MKVRVNRQVNQVTKMTRYRIKILPQNGQAILASYARLWNPNTSYAPLGNPDKTRNLWVDPPKASPALKSIIQEFKHTLKASDQWDGDFTL